MVELFLVLQMHLVRVCVCVFVAVYMRLFLCAHNTYLFVYPYILSNLSFFYSASVPYAHIYMCGCASVVCRILVLHLDNMHFICNRLLSSLSLSVFTTRSQCNCLIFSFHPRQTYTRPYQLPSPSHFYFHHCCCIKFFNCILCHLYIYINTEREREEKNLEQQERDMCSICI